MYRARGPHFFSWLHAPGVDERDNFSGHAMFAFLKISNFRERLPLSLHLQGAEVSGISDVQNPPQPPHPGLTSLRFVPVCLQLLKYLELYIFTPKRKRKVKIDLTDICFSEGHHLSWTASCSISIKRSPIQANIRLAS